MRVGEYVCHSQQDAGTCELARKAGDDLGSPWLPSHGVSVLRHPTTKQCFVGDVIV